MPTAYGLLHRYRMYSCWLRKRPWVILLLMILPCAGCSAGRSPEAFLTQTGPDAARPSEGVPTSLANGIITVERTPVYALRPVQGEQGQAAGAYRLAEGQRAAAGSGMGSGGPVSAGPTDFFSPLGLLSQQVQTGQASAPLRFQTFSVGATQAEGQAGAQQGQGLQSSGPGLSPPQVESPRLRSIRQLRDRFPGQQIVFPEDLGGQRSETREYLIGVEDALSISIWRYPDLSATTRVLPDGRIYLHLVGPVPARGLTVEQLQQELEKRYRAFVPSPQVTIIPVQQKSREVFLSGRVSVTRTASESGALAPAQQQVTLPGGAQVTLPGRAEQQVPGSPELPSQSTLPSSVLILTRESTLLEILNRLQFAADADLHSAYIARRGIIIPVDIARLLEGDLTQNVPLEPRDTLVVPPLDRKKVYVFGEVARPGPVFVVGGTALDALTQAGGLTPRSDLELAYMTRSNAVLPVDFVKLFREGDASQDIPVQEGDYIFIPSLVERRVYVVGEVNRPGIIQYSGQLDLVAALAASGFIRYTGREAAVHVVRGNLQDPLVMRVNMNRVWRGELGRPIPLQSGDIVFVPPTALTSWNRILAQVLPSLFPLQIITPFLTGAPQNTINLTAPAVQ